MNIILNLDSLAQALRLIFYSLAIVLTLMLMANFSTREWKWVGGSFVCVASSQGLLVLVALFNVPQYSLPIMTFVLTPALAFFVVRLALALMRWKLRQGQ